MGIIAIGLMIVGFLVVSLPFASVLVGSGLHSILNCSPGGGSPGVCEIGGAEAGRLVWNLGMAGWAIMVTFLPGLGIMIVGVILGVLSRDKSKNSPAQNSNSIAES